MSYLCFVEAVDCFRESIVMAIADTADGSPHTRLR